MLVPENKDYRKDGNGGGSLPLDINSPIYYGGVPTGINTTFLEVKIVALFVVALPAWEYLSHYQCQSTVPLVFQTDGLSFFGCLKDLTFQTENRTRNLSPR